MGWDGGGGGGGGGDKLDSPRSRRRELDRKMESDTRKRTSEPGEEI